jgi:acetoacetyl-CoA synthetase
MINESPLWKPSHIQKTGMYHFLTYINKQYDLTFETYQSLYSFSIEQPDLFWKAIASFFNIEWTKPPSVIFQKGSRFIDTKWFVDGEFSFAKQCLSAKDETAAIHYIDENNHTLTYTYGLLKQHVTKMKAFYQANGILKGDVIAGLVTNHPFAIIAMLAANAIGAIWTACSPDFGITALCDRFSEVTPKVLIATQSHQYQGKEHANNETIQALITALPSVSHVILYGENSHTVEIQTDRHQSTFESILSHPHDEPLTFESLPFAHPLYILFSSGTTGKPKCIVHGQGGTLLQHLKELHLHSDLHSTDNLCFYTTTGWMMWHWMVSTLALGGCITLVEGSPAYPTIERLFSIIEQFKITHLGTSARFLSTLEQNAFHNPYESTSLRVILSTGSPLLPHQFDYVYEHIQSTVQLSSISGGTDIISCFALGNPMLPVFRGEIQCIGLGMAVKIVNEEGHAIEGEQGELVATKPFPSMPIYFWHDPNQERYLNAYFSRFPTIWTHGDYATLTAHHGLIIHGRSDATLNPGGVRIGTAEIYRALSTLTYILDAVAISHNYHGDPLIILFVTLKDPIILDDTIKNDIKKTLKSNASPRHVPSFIYQLSDIPKTMNGKLVELAVKQAFHKEPVTNKTALLNPWILAEIEQIPLPK